MKEPIASGSPLNVLTIRIPDVGPTPNGARTLSCLWLMCLADHSTHLSEGKTDITQLKYLASEPAQTTFLSARVSTLGLCVASASARSQEKKHNCVAIAGWVQAHGAKISATGAPISLRFPMGTSELQWRSIRF